MVATANPPETVSMYWTTAVTSRECALSITTVSESVPVPDRGSCLATPSALIPMAFILEPCVSFHTLL